MPIALPSSRSTPSLDPQGGPCLPPQTPGKGWTPQASSLTTQWPLGEVPVLVMVTPVNEFSPACVPRTFRIREDAGPHTLLGSVVGTDKDYPHNSIEYYISGGPTTFSVDRLSGTSAPGLGWREGTGADSAG